jgi:hypothetical protein
MSFWIQYPNLTFDEEKHIYRWNGKEVPSVTQLFDRVGVRNDDKSPWGPLGCPEFAKKEHDAIFGSAFHKLANALILRKEVSFPEEMRSWYEKLLRFINKYEISPLFDSNGNPIAEYPMYSTFHDFACTPDFCGREFKSNNIWIIEWKSSAQYQKSFSWQTAGQTLVLRDVFGGRIFDKREKIVRCTVLVSAAKENAEPVFRNNNPEDFIAFQSILNTYKLAA